MKVSRFLTFGTLAIVLLSGAVLAQDIPLNNWTVPPYTRGSEGGLTTMTDATPPRLFIGIQPCRVTDTRGNGAPIQGGIFAAAETRTWDITNICGIPPGADAISANFTVTGAPVAPPGSFILAWPTGGPVPPVSIMNFQAGQTLANAAIVPLGAGEQINVNTSASVHIIMDVNGYFSDTLQTPANYLQLTNNSGIWTAQFTNQSTTCGGTCGLTVSTASGHAIVANASETTADVNYGVYGEANSSGSGTAGVRGFSDNSAGATYGVFGETDSTFNGAAGVLGVAGSRVNVGLAATFFDTAVRAETNGTSANGVLGIILNTSSGFAVGGFSYPPGAASNSLIGRLADESANLGVSYFGGLGGSGSKAFLEPHPTDATKMIKYVSLEGPEAGTYFRGRAKIQGGIAVIEVPESFRIVTDPEGLSIQVTPIGQMATVAVESIDLNRIVVRGSRNVEFFYLVNGVRTAYRDVEVITENNFFVPQSPEARMPLSLSPVERQRLIDNGTYREDGTVNMETARKLGWDKVWEKIQLAPEPTP